MFVGWLGAPSESPSDFTCSVGSDVSLAFFFFSSRRRHTRLVSDWSSDVCSSDLLADEILRQRLANLEILVGREKAKRSGRSVVPTADRLRHVMKIVDRAAAAAQKCADIVCKPQSAPNIHERFR